MARGHATRGTARARHLHTLGRCSYLHTLDDLPTVKKLVAFNVTEHKQTMPHRAFQGQTMRWTSAVAPKCPTSSPLYAVRHESNA